MATEVLLLHNATFHCITKRTNEKYCLIIYSVDNLSDFVVNCEIRLWMAVVLCSVSAAPTLLYCSYWVEMYTNCMYVYTMTNYTLCTYPFQAVI